jgi:hypothetical protein
MTSKTAAAEPTGYAADHLTDLAFDPPLRLPGWWQMTTSAEQTYTQEQANEQARPIDTTGATPSKRALSASVRF